MNIYISIDMEGISGISSISQTDPNHRKYEEGLFYMKRELESILKILKNYNIKKIVVNDAHWNMDNLNIKDFENYEIELISGSPKMLSMMEGINSNFRYALFIGYHSSANSIKGFIDHTYSSYSISEIKINGKKVNEAYINGLIASYYNVSVGLISGDDRLIEECKDLFKEVEFVITKYSLSRYAVRLINFNEVYKRYSTAIENMLKKDIKPLDMPKEFEIEITFRRTEMVDIVEILPIVERIDGNKILFRENDFIRAFRYIRVMINLARSV